MSDAETAALLLQSVFHALSVGVTLDEICVISAARKNVVPVRSEERRMRLLDLSAPFLFCGHKRYYG